MSCRNDTHTRSQGPSNYEITKSYGGYHNFMRSFILQPGQEDEAAEILDAFKKADMEAAASSDDPQSDPYHASSRGYEGGSDDDGSSISPQSSERMSDCSGDLSDSPSAGSTAIFDHYQEPMQSDEYDSDNDDVERFFEDEGAYSDEGEESDPEHDMDDLNCCDDEDDRSDAYDNTDSDPSDSYSDVSDDFD